MNGIDFFWNSRTETHGSSGSQRALQGALETPSDHEYSQVDVTHLLECHFKDAKNESIGPGLFQQDNRYLFLPITPYTGTPSQSSEEVFSSLFREFYPRCSAVEEILVPFNSGAHWIILRFFFRGNQIEAHYIDSLSADESGVAESRDHYVGQLQGCLEKMFSDCHCGTLQEVNGSKIQIKTPQIHPDKTSCGPIMAFHIIRLFQGVEASITDDIGSIRRQQHHFLLSNGFELDRDPIPPPQPIGETASSINTAKNVSNRKAPVFDEDAIESSMCILNSCPAKVVDDKQAPLLEIKLSIEDKLRLDYQQLNAYQHEPLVVLQIIKQTDLPLSQIIHFKIRALTQLVKTANDEIQSLTKRVEKGEERDSSSLAFHFEKQQLLTKELEAANKKKKELEREWNQKLNSFYQKVPLLLLGEVETLFEDFFALRKLRPFSLAPYYPLLLFIHRFDNEDKADLIEEAKGIDPYQTYALIVNAIRVSATMNQENTSVLFKGFDPIYILRILQTFYPQDSVLPVLLQAYESETQSAPVNFSQVAASLNMALSSLASENFDDAIHTLAEAKPFLMGYSTLYYYLAIAWMHQGDIEKAIKLAGRVQQLPSLHPNDSKMLKTLMSILAKCFPQVIDSSNKTEVKNPPPRNLLEIFVELAKTQNHLNLDVAKEFIDKSKELLCTDTDEMPLIYFGVRWISSRLIMQQDAFEERRPLFISLSELLTAAVARCYQAEFVDSWITERFTPQTNEDGETSFLIHFPYVQFGNCEPEAIPQFVFSQHLSLTYESIRAIATSLTKQLYHLLLGMMTSHLIPELAAADPSMMPADNATMFIQILDEGLRMESNSLLYQSSLAYLRQYLNMDPQTRPYSVNDEILGWAVFCSYTHIPTLSPAPDQLEQAILTTYYFEESFQKNFDVLVRPSKEVAQHLCHGVNLKTMEISIAARDVMLAHLRMGERTLPRQGELQLPCDSDSLYDVFLFSQKLYGWRLDESFENWGSRLQKAYHFGPGASEINMLEHIDKRDAKLSDAEGVIASPDSARVQVLLQRFLRFWMEFHEKTVQKNHHIAAGGDENEADTKEVNWFEGMQESLRKRIVSSNKPEDHPNYKQLNEKKRETLHAIVNEKHKHAQEIEILKKIQPKKLKDQEYLNAMGTALLVSMEYAREHAYHSLWIKNESNARDLYRLLLEVSAERMVRNQIISFGVDSWIAGRVAVIEDLFFSRLESLITAFHGPENHISGKGPLQNHYNAGVVTSKGTIENTHIYCD